MMKTPKAKPAAAERRSGVQSIEVGARLLGVMAEHAGPMNLRDIAAASGMSASKAHRYLISLLRAGLAEQDPVSGRYDLGPMSLRVGLASLNRRMAVQYATRALIELNQAEDLTVALTVWGEHGATVVAWYDSVQVLICNITVGSTLPLLRSASGQVYLAYLPSATTRSLVERELALIGTYIPHAAVKTKHDVSALIQRVRKDRVGMTHEDFVPGLSAIAAPIFRHGGQLVASILVVGYSGQVHATGPRAIRDSILRVADSVSASLGFDATQLDSPFVERLERGDYAATEDERKRAAKPVPEQDRAEAAAPAPKRRRKAAAS
ncbi:MAG: putative TRANSCRIPTIONal IclR family [Paucimonas sp.]|nr:putative TRANSCRIPTIONal IclR family [Paucimonas sp.]